MNVCSFFLHYSQLIEMSQRLFVFGEQLPRICASSVVRGVVFFMFLSSLHLCLPFQIFSRTNESTCQFCSRLDFAGCSVMHQRRSGALVLLCSVFVIISVCVCFSVVSYQSVSVVSYQSVSVVSYQSHLQRYIFLSHLCMLCECVCARVCVRECVCECV